MGYCHVRHAVAEDLLREVDDGAVQREALTLVDGDGIGQDERVLFPVHVVVFHHHEFALDLLDLVGLVDVVKVHGDARGRDGQHGADGAVD